MLKKHDVVYLPHPAPYLRLCRHSAQLIKMRRFSCIDDKDAARV
jgi:hypothetical protein